MQGTLRLTIAAILVASISAGAAVAGSKLGTPPASRGTSTFAKPAILTPADELGSALTSAEKHAIEDAVRVQLLALAQLDAKLAFDRLAPSTQRYFKGPDRYLSTLAISVAPILQTRHFTFLGSERIKDRIVQQVLIADETGGQWLAEFEVVRELGDWRVKACVVEPAPGQQA
jgi:uncharacterized protein DUF4864